MAKAIEPSSVPRAAQSPSASSPTADGVHVVHAHESLWGKLARHFRQKPKGQTDGDEDSDAHDDMRRAGDREPDEVATLDKLVSIAFRSGQGGI